MLWIVRTQHCSDVALTLDLSQTSGCHFTVRSFSFRRWEGDGGRWVHLWPLQVFAAALRRSQQRWGSIWDVYNRKKTVDHQLCFAVDFQNYLRTQIGSTTTINIIICTVDYLLRLQVPGHRLVCFSHQEKNKWLLSIIAHYFSVVSIQGVNQRFLLVLLRQGCHWWTGEKELLQGHDSG